MSNKILILTGRSLFADGVISKLLNSPLEGKFDVVDMRQPDPLQAVVKANPDYLILDETDPELTEQLKCDLLTAVSHLKVIYLDPQKNHLRVLQCVEYDNSQIWDLLNEIDDTNDFSPKTIPPAGIQKDAKSQLNANLPA
jgi:hypothetical protein